MTNLPPPLVCQRCQHAWYPRGGVLPRICPKCKSPYWNEAEKPKPGPKPKG